MTRHATEVIKFIVRELGRKANVRIWTDAVAGTALRGENDVINVMETKYL